MFGNIGNVAASCRLCTASLNYHFEVECIFYELNMMVRSRYEI